MLKNLKDKTKETIQSKAKEVINASPVKPMIIPMDNTLSDCKLAFEKSYRFYGVEHDSWVNEKIPRLQVLQKVHNGDPVDFRPVPWQRGTMFLCIHRKTGLDFGVLISEVARKLQRDYYGCYMVGTVEDIENDLITVQVWQPPQNL